MQCERAEGRGLPPITGHFGLVGGGNTAIRRSPAALSAFRVLDVASGAAS